MATGLRYLNYSQKLLQMVSLESSKQSYINCLIFTKVYRPLCTKFTTEDEFKAFNSDIRIDDYFGKNTKNVRMDKGDNFGNLKISLERQNAEKNHSLPPSKPRKKSNRKDRFLLQSDIPNESDTFGNLTKDSVWYSDIEEPEPTDDSTEFVPERGRFTCPRGYLAEMKRLVNEKRLKEALELFPDMRANGMYPISAQFTFMIGACGRAGYTEMAFDLLKQMTDRCHWPTPATLTGLFNACAECPFPDYGLQRALFLRGKIAEKNWQLSPITYRAMIKAFGKCGDLLAAFQIVDEMIEAGIFIDVQTYQCLLLSCISDKEAGFTHAVEVWRKLIAKRFKPNIYCFNLLLRAARDCGVGPEETASLLLQHWSSYTKRPYGLNREKIAAQNEMLKLSNPQLLMIEGGNSPTSKLIEGINDTSEKNYQQAENVSARTTDEVSNVSASDEQMLFKEQQPKIVANLLAPRPHCENFVALLEIKTATDRVALLGNAEGILESMAKNQVKPNIKTFMLLLETLPSNIESEKALISMMDKEKVSPDVDFFNILIKRRNLRKDFTSAKQVLSLINNYNLSIDVVTFGVLALGCFKRKYGQQLLQEIKRFKCHPNVEIMGALFHNAIRINDLEYLRDLMESMKYQAIKPNERILMKLETTIDTIRNSIIDKEQGKGVPDFILSEKFCNQFYSFCDYYTEWLKTMDVQIEGHPWDQYRSKKLVKVGVNVGL